jgi:hypothetical protein
MAFVKFFWANESTISLRRVMMDSWRAFSCSALCAALTAIASCNAFRDPLSLVGAFKIALSNAA